ncbi:MAG: hypothetical protein ACXVCP_07335 [Bdellovibrio sp.]
MVSYIFKTNYDGKQAMTSPNTDGLGLFMLGDINSYSSLEITMISMSKTYFRRDNGLLLVEKVPTVHVSIGYKNWYNEKLSGSMSLFTSYPLEEAEKIYNEFPPGQESITTAREKYETGLDFGLERELWISGRYAFYGGIRYSLSLTRKSSEFSDQYGILIGLRYFVQGKDKPREFPF